MPGASCSLLWDNCGLDRRAESAEGSEAVLSQPGLELTGLCRLSNQVLVGALDVLAHTLEANLAPFLPHRIDTAVPYIDTSNPT